MLSSACADGASVTSAALIIDAQPSKHVVFVASILYHYA
jgi:hypothetical protein